MSVPPHPTVTPIAGELPNRGQSETQFDTNQQNFVNYQANLGPEINVALAWFEDTANQTEVWAGQAQELRDESEGFRDEAAASAASALQSPGTNATSTTTFTPAFGSNSFTLAQTGKNFVVGQFVTVADASDPSNKYLNGAITAFNSGTGAMTVNARDVVGASSGSNWVITAAAPSYGERFVSPVQNAVDHGTVSGTYNIDLRAGLSHKLTTGGNLTITVTMPDIFTNSTQTWVLLDITKGGSHTIVFPVPAVWSDGVQPVQNSGTRFEYLGTKFGTDSWVFSAPRKNIS